MAAHVYLMAQDKVKGGGGEEKKKVYSISGRIKTPQPFPRGKNCFESCKQDSTNLAFLVYPQLS